MKRKSSSRVPSGTLQGLLSIHVPVNLVIVQTNHSWINFHFYVVQTARWSALIAGIWWGNKRFAENKVVEDEVRRFSPSRLDTNSHDEKQTLIEDMISTQTNFFP